MAAIRLLLDADVDPDLAEVLSARGYDGIAARRAGLGEAEDAEILKWAIRRERAVLTHNIRHFVPLAREYAERGWEHHGIIVSDQLPFAELLGRVLRLLGSKTAENLMNALEWLQNYR